MARLNDQEIRDLIGELYQTVSAIVHQNEHPTSDGDALDGELLCILSDPDSKPLAVSIAKCREIQDYYWAKQAGNVTATPDAAQPSLSDKAGGDTIND